MIFYKIRLDQLKDEDIGRYISYGIDVVENEAVLRSVKDITTDEARLSGLVDLCNKLQLSPVQLDDVIEDFLVF